MKTLILLLALGGCLFGQTAPTTNQLKATDPPVPTGKVYVLTPDGVLKFATLGQGLILTCDTAGCALDTPAVALPPRQLQVVTVAVAKLLEFDLASPMVAGELDVLRNGIELTQGVDYTISGQKITFVAGAEPLLGDIVRIKYR